MYGSSSSQGPYYPQPDAQTVPLQFYNQSTFYPGSRSSLEGNVGPQGSIAQQGVSSAYGGNIQTAGGWWTAFGTGGFEGEPPLLEGMLSLTFIICQFTTTVQNLGSIFRTLVPSP